MHSSSQRIPNYDSQNTTNYYPLLWQFEQLSLKASKNNNNNNKISKKQFSPREEIYRSMIKELTDKNNSSAPDSTNNASLIKKASGILRLTHLKNQSSEQSTKSNAATQYKRVSFRRSADSVRTLTNSSDSSNVRIISESNSSADLASNLNFKEIWDYMDVRPVSSKPSNRKTEVNGNLQSDSKSQVPGLSQSRTQSLTRRPPWRYFSKSKTLSMSNSDSYRKTNPFQLSSKIPSTSSLYKNLLKDGSKGPSESVPASTKPQSHKRSGVNNVVSVRGQLVVFNGDGFEGLTNWFEDPTILKYLKPRSSFIKELDLTGFSPQEIHFRLQDGHKLVVDAVRENSKGTPTARFKHTIVLPRYVKIENLIVCRHISGRLIIQDVERPKTVK